MRAQTELLEKNLDAHARVQYLDLQWVSENELTVLVVLDDGHDTASYDSVVGIVDDFARDHVEDLTVDAQIVDSSHAALFFQHA